VLLRFTPPVAQPAPQSTPQPSGAVDVQAGDVGGRSGATPYLASEFAVLLTTNCGDLRAVPISCDPVAE